MYQYKDHLGNIRLSYAKNPATQVLTIIDENNYYPFGLKHNGYNDYVPTSNKYKYQGQERQDELGLEWDSFKYRNYDYAIGRFMSIDPLAENYPYNSTYAFQENKLGMGTELEGKELQLHNWLAVDAVVNPNGVGAHTMGFSQGLTNIGVGLWNAVKNPVSTAKGLGNTALWLAVGSQGSEALDSALGTNSSGAGDTILNGVYKGTDSLINGDGVARGEVVGEVAGSLIAGEVIGAGFSKVRSTMKGGLSEAPVTNELYSRPNNATTAAQRKSVQGKPCVDCGGTSEPMIANHIKPLVQEWYETGSIDLKKMKSTESVNSHCQTCSGKQAGEMSAYSKKMKAIINDRKK